MGSVVVGLVTVVVVLAVLVAARAGVDDAAEDALVFGVRVAPVEAGEVGTHALGGLAVVQEFGGGAPFGGVLTDGVAGCRSFHGRGGGGAGQVRRGDVGEWRGISRRTRMGEWVVKLRVGGGRVV